MALSISFRLIPAVRWGATVALGVLLTTWGIATVWPIRDVRVLHAHCGIVLGEFRILYATSGNLTPEDVGWSDFPLTQSRVPWPFVTDGATVIGVPGEPMRTGTITTVGIPIWMTVLPLATVVLGLWRPVCIQSLRRKSGCCPACGYDMTGNRSGKCPECGSAGISPEASTPIEGPSSETGCRIER